MIQVIDNVIGQKYSQFVFDEMSRLKWTFVPDISLGQSKENHPGFSHSLYLHEEFNNNRTGTIVAQEYYLIAPILLEASDKLGKKFTLDHIFRCRARLTVNQDKIKMGNPHRDYQIPHLVLIYYVNSTDGDTLLFDDKNRIIERVTPRRGRVVLFDGSILHSASNSTEQPRIIINTNIRA